jgi:uncharacterized membrane protein
MGRACYESTPVALYGVVMLLAGGAYYLLARSLVKHHGAESQLAKALGTDMKGKASLAVYAAAIPLAFVSSWIALALYVAVAAWWLVPDRRFENATAHAHEEHRS